MHNSVCACSPASSANLLFSLLYWLHSTKMPRGRRGSRGKTTAMSNPESQVMFAQCAWRLTTIYLLSVPWAQQFEGHWSPMALMVNLFRGTASTLGMDDSLIYTLQVAFRSIPSVHHPVTSQSQPYRPDCYKQRRMSNAVCQIYCA